MYPRVVEPAANSSSAFRAYIPCIPKRGVVSGLMYNISHSCFSCIHHIRPYFSPKSLTCTCWHISFTLACSSHISAHSSRCWLKHLPASDSDHKDDSPTRRHPSHASASPLNHDQFQTLDGFSDSPPAVLGTLDSDLTSASLYSV